MDHQQQVHKHWFSSLIISWFNTEQDDEKCQTSAIVYSDVKVLPLALYGDVRPTSTRDGREENMIVLHNAHKRFKTQLGAVIKRFNLSRSSVWNMELLPSPAIVLCLYPRG